MLLTIIFGILIGLITSFLWGVALGIVTKTALIIGAIAGVIVGLMVGIFGKLAKTGGNLVQGEITFVSTSIIIIIGVFSISTGLIALLIHFIFF